MVKLLSLILASLIGSSASAAVEIESISGASASSTVSPVEVFGGVAGVCPGGAGTGLCNSCSAIGVGTIDACNEKRIQRSATLVVNLKAAGQVNAQFVDTDDLPIGGTGSVQQATITWDELCTLATVADCDADNGGLGTGPPKTVNVRVWQDNNSDGDASADEIVNIKVSIVPPGPDEATNACTECVRPFTTFPGDEKIYLDDMILPSSSLSNGSKLAAIRVFISDASFHMATPQDAFAIQDLNVTIPTSGSGGEVDTNRIEGLENGTIYHFRLGILDKAQNVFGITNDDYISETTTNTCVVGADNPTTDAVLGGCPHAGKPDQVLGMLTKDLNCFIATAAYDSSLEPKLNVFRQFRHSILLRRAWGKSFVRWYYKEGPKAALMIHDKPWLKTLTRIFLWPAYGFATLSLRLGFAAAIAIFVFLPLILLSAFIASRRRSSRG